MAVKRPMGEKDIEDITKNIDHFSKEVRTKLINARLEIERLRVGEAEFNLRCRDLVRHCRNTLYDQGLITYAEYSKLASDYGAVKRIQDYEELMRRLRDADALNGLDSIVNIFLEKRW